MATSKTISAALNLIDAKKENLRRAFDDLQSNSSLLDLDSHFTSLQHSLTHRFHFLQSLEQSHSQSQPKTLIANIKASFPANPNDPTSNQNDCSAGVFPENYVVPGSVMPRYELSVLCEKMDGIGLRNYVKDHLKDRIRVQAELPGALQCAPDPALLVLESLAGFHKVNGGSKDGEFRKMRKCCVMLLKQLGAAAVSVSSKAREKALKFALEWKVRLVGDDANILGALGFLYLVYAFGIVSEFSMDELVEFSVMAAVNDRFPQLCRAIGLTDRVPEIVQKLIDRGKHVLAVKYVFEFNLADKIPPIPILEACVDASKKLAKRLSQEGKSLIEITDREIRALKSVIEIIENHKLESEYPRASLEQRLEQLKGKDANMKHAAPASVLTQHRLQRRRQKRKMKKQKEQQSGIKRPRRFTSVGPAAVLKNVNNGYSTICQYQQPLVSPSGLFPKHPIPYMSSAVMPLGMVAPTPTIPPYTGPSAEPYGFAGIPMGPRGYPSLGGSHLNSSEPHVASAYYGRASTYGGINLQHHYQASYYPQ